VDAGEALGEDGADPKVQGRKCGVLPARALPVIVAPNDKARRHLLSLLGVVRVETPEGELGDLRHVRAERHHLDPVGRHVPGRDVVFDDYGHLTREVVG
jgi:hypothetical protein